MTLQLVEMEHPHLPGQRARVPVQSVPHHQRAGWVMADDPPGPGEEITEAPAEPGASTSEDTEPPKRRRASTKEE